MILQQKKKTINNWMILYTRGDAFNGWFPIGDVIGEGFNGKGGQSFELLQIMIGLFDWQCVVEYSISWD